jgi:excisionase family DNA binding protein
MRVYTVKEISDLYKLTEIYIRTEIRNGNLRAANFGRRAGYRINEEDLKAWTESKQNSKEGK